MSFLKFILMGTTVFIVLSIFSCQNDNLSKPVEDATTPIITKKEVHEIIDATELLRVLIKESFTQLLYNHDFNPLMPQIPTRLTCNTCSHADCGCPFQDTSLDPNLNVYPQILAMKYYEPNQADCTCTLANGLRVTGEIRLTFSTSFATGGHIITMEPQDDFEVDGYDVDATKIELTNTNMSGTLTTYNITALDNVVITKNGAATTFSSIGSKSKFVIDDIGNNHGNIANAFGLLDDKFKLTMDELKVTCSNGESVVGYTISDLEYNMNCDNIQDGKMELREPIVGSGPMATGGGLLATYDYAAPNALGSGVCDTIITVTTN